MQYVAYYRLSRESKSGKKEGRHLGLEAQRAMITHYHPDIAMEFTEIKSAKNITDRTELQKAIKYCQENAATLVVAKLDRLSRDVDDCRLIWNQLNQRILFCDIPGTPDLFIITMYAAFAERERDLIAIRTKQALKAKKDRGEVWHRGKFPSWAGHKGGAVLKERAIMSEDNQRAMAVIKDKREKGMPFKEITSYLNTNKFKSARGNTFSKASVAGLYRRNKEIIQST